MAMSQTLREAMNDQIRHELYSAYLYLSMAAYFEAMNLPGFAHWMRVQAREEVGHAMKFFDHLCDRGERVILQAIEQPPVDFAPPRKPSLRPSSMSAGSPASSRTFTRSPSARTIPPACPCSTGSWKSKSRKKRAWNRSWRRSGALGRMGRGWL